MTEDTFDLGRYLDERCQFRVHDAMIVASALEAGRQAVHSNPSSHLPRPHSPMQRLLDIFFSGLALLVLSPLLVPIAIALRLSGEGEVFYVQQRVGRGGRMFGLYKFATMLKDSPNLGTGTVTVKYDPRVLPLGRILRKTKLNELPQLLNIFKGDMSVIGPRPQTRRCFDAFPARSQAQIVKVRPGLSGIGSIVFRDEEDLMHASAEPEHFYDAVIMPYKGALEEWYVANQGLWTYLCSIVVTAWVVLVPTSTVFWRVFDGLPLPPAELVAAGGAVGAPDGAGRGDEMMEKEG